jgi:hypothetical protein
MGRMKALAAALALTFALLQPVSLTECPCGFLCGHKNAIEGAKDAVLDDCCSRAGTGTGLHRPEPTGDLCFHVEPQTEITGFAVEPATPASVETEFIQPPMAVPASDQDDLPFASGLSPPARGRPLYLRHVRFLI